MDFINNNKEKILKYLFIVATVILIYLTVNYIFRYIAPFAIGYVFSLMLEPLAKFIMKKFKTGRAIPAVVCTILLAIIIVFLSSGIISQLIQQGTAFTRYAISYINSLPELLSGLQDNYLDYISFLPEEYHTTLNDMFSSLITSVASSLGSLLRTGTGNVASVVASFLFGALITIISSFFFVKDRYIIRNYIKNASPGWFVDAYRSVKTGVAGAFLGYMKSQLIMMAPTALICLTGLSIMRYPYALFIGLIIAVLDMMPMLGAGLILGPWALFSFLTGNVMTGVGLAVMYVVIVITRQIIEPKVIGQQIGVHPLITLMSIYIGLRVFGIFGFLIGPMTVVILKVLIFGESIFSDKTKTPGTDAPETGNTGV